GMRIPDLVRPDTDPDEAVDGRRDLEPVPHLVFICAVTQHNAADFLAPIAPCQLDEALAVINAIEPFDLPDIRLNSGVLQRANGIEHKCRPDVSIVSFCAPDTIELRVRRRHQELEHELLTGCSAVLRQSPESRRLTLVERSITFGVVAHQSL